MAASADARRIETLIQPTADAMGYRLVRVLISGRHTPRLQVMAERRDDRPMGVDDCAELSRALSAVLDVEDPMPGSYTLEVSSPGLDRPLTRLEDYTRFAGREANVETRAPVGGRRRFRGQLLGVAEGKIILKVEGSDVALPFDEIDKARLVVTGDVLAQAMRQ